MSSGVESVSVKEGQCKFAASGSNDIKQAEDKCWVLGDEFTLNVQESNGDKRTSQPKKRFEFFP